VSNENILIGITGPESTGKSTLSSQLAEYFHGAWIPEFARLYLGKNSHYQFSDYLAISRAQLNRQIFERHRSRGMILFDTEETVIKLWGEVKFGHFPNMLQKLYVQCQCDYYLLMCPDLPWEFDPLRENPNDRDLLFEKYIEVLTVEKKPFSTISGVGDIRLQNAIKSIKKVIEL